MEDLRIQHEFHNFVFNESIDLLDNSRASFKGKPLEQLNRELEPYWRKNSELFLICRNSNWSVVLINIGC